MSAGWCRCSRLFAACLFCCGPPKEVHNLRAAPAPSWACLCSAPHHVSPPKPTYTLPQHRKAAEQMYQLCVDLRGFYLKVSLLSTACCKCMLLLLCNLLC